MANPIEELNRGCNLFRRGTHAIVIDDFTGFIYVSRRDIAFRSDDTLQAETMASNDFNDPQGCARCPLYRLCLPAPFTILIGNILRAAQQTSFTGG